MFGFGKKKCYSLGEKRRYFTSILNDNNESPKRKEWARQRLNTINRIKSGMKVGDVYIVDDKHIGGRQRKPRLVVFAKKDNQDFVKVIPVYKDKKLMSLSQFDGDRAISLNNVKTITNDKIYEKKGFKFKGANLTPKEKDRLRIKVNKYIEQKKAHILIDKALR